MGNPLWLPPKESFSGEWEELLDRTYNRFVKDIVQSGLTYRGRRISVRKHPPADGKEFGFWHCISEGCIEEERIVDHERCKRIGWIRAIIENCSDPLLESWVERNRGQTDHILWFREEYVVVLSERGKAADGRPDCFLLKTAYCTFAERQKRKKRKARDEAKKANAAP